MIGNQDLAVQFGTAGKPALGAALPGPGVSHLTGSALMSAVRQSVPLLGGDPAGPGAAAPSNGTSAPASPAAAGGFLPATASVAALAGAP